MTDESGGESPVRKKKVVREIKGAPKRPKKPLVDPDLVRKVVDLAKDNARAIAIVVGVFGFGWFSMGDDKIVVADFQDLIERQIKVLGEDSEWSEDNELEGAEVFNEVLWAPVTHQSETYDSRMARERWHEKDYKTRGEHPGFVYEPYLKFQPIISYRKLRLITEYMENNPEGKELKNLRFGAREYFSNVPDYPIGLVVSP